jgi:hypothetical protein
MRHIVFSLLLIALVGSSPRAVAGSGSWHCVGTRHPSGSQDAPTSFDLPDVAAASQADAESDARHINLTGPTSYDTDSVTCSQNAAMPKISVFCSAEGYRRVDGTRKTFSMAHHQVDDVKEGERRFVDWWALPTGPGGQKPPWVLQRHTLTCTKL